MFQRNMSIFGWFRLGPLLAHNPIEAWKLTNLFPTQSVRNAPNCCIGKISRHFLNVIAVRVARLASCPTLICQLASYTMVTDQSPLSTMLHQYFTSLHVYHMIPHPRSIHLSLWKLGFSLQRNRSKIALNYMPSWSPSIKLPRCSFHLVGLQQLTRCWSMNALDRWWLKHVETLALPTRWFWPWTTRSGGWTWLNQPSATSW